VVWGPKSLEIKIDSPLWISGKNGVGKSTLMKSIIGRAMIYSGAIRVSEKINLDQISLVGQQPFLPLVDQNTLSEIEANPNFKTFKSLFEIESVFNKYSEDLRSFCESNFSGGEIQRLCIFLVLMTKVKWLILDEPFSGLPQADRLKLISAVKDFCLQQQITFWVVSHDDLIGFERLDLNEV
jgi:ABC-type multidrug transport system ATPase subunit